MENMRFKVGDRVRIKSFDWYNENKDENIDFNTPLVLQMTSKMSLFCDDVVTIKEVNYNYYSIYEDNNTFCWTDEMIECKVEEEIIDIDDFQDDNEIIDIIDEYVHRLKNNECQINLPEGYQFTDENGNIINARKIVLEKKKKEYPKTYEGCCGVLGLNIWSELKNTVFDTMYKRDLMSAFHRLLICRDAYWEIAGQEMGLGKPWKPDLLNDNQDKFVLANWDDNIEKHDYSTNRNYILTFPTEEMRDAFYENFKSEIEFCKELL